MQTRNMIFFLMTLCAAVTGCAPVLPVAQAADTQTAAGPEQIVIRGEVARLELEGGFWGILGADGQRYDPGTLAREFQQAGLKVRVEAKVAVGRISFRQWGKPIDIIRIEKLDAP